MQVKGWGVGLIWHSKLHSRTLNLVWWFSLVFGFYGSVGFGYKGVGRVHAGLKGSRHRGRRDSALKG